jgi:hypothetical protein
LIQPLAQRRAFIGETGLVRGFDNHSGFRNFDAQHSASVSEIDFHKLKSRVVG